jgi:hypothetical protein
LHVWHGWRGSKTGHMKKSTFGFSVEPDGEVVRISQDDIGGAHEIIVTPHEIDLLISMLKDARDAAHMTADYAEAHKQVPASRME